MKKLGQYVRLLAVAPSTRGLGFALLENGHLIDWGIKSARPKRSSQNMPNLMEVIARYQPHMIVMEDHSAKGSRRCPRIRALGQRIINEVTKRNITYLVLPRQQVKRFFSCEGRKTKHDLAKLVARRFPDEVACRLPQTRLPWESESY